MSGFVGGFLARIRAEYPANLISGPSLYYLYGYSGTATICPVYFIQFSYYLCANIYQVLSRISRVENHQRRRKEGGQKDRRIKSGELLLLLTGVDVQCPHLVFPRGGGGFFHLIF